MTGEIPIDDDVEGDDEAPPISGFHEPEPEEMETIFSWFRRKAVDLADGTAEVVVEGAAKVSEVVGDMKELLDENPEVEVMTEFTLMSIINRFMRRRIMARLPETDPEFREKVQRMMRESLKDDERTFDADYEIL